MNNLKEKSFAQLAKSDIWMKHLKPYLKEIEARFTLKQEEAKTEFEAVQKDIKRTNAIFIINEIIDRVERAENNLEKLYKK